jgi:hypothetical protein
MVSYRQHYRKYPNGIWICTKPAQRRTEVWRAAGRHLYTFPPCRLSLDAALPRAASGFFATGQKVVQSSSEVVVAGSRRAAGAGAGAVVVPVDAEGAFGSRRTAALVDLRADATLVAAVALDAAEDAEAAVRDAWRAPADAAGFTANRAAAMAAGFIGTAPATASVTRNALTVSRSRAA